MISYKYCLPAIAKALSVIKVGVSFTPSQINRATGNGSYASKYVMLMNKYYGFTVTTQKDGKRVVSYTVIREPKNVAELRAYSGREKAAKPTKAAKPAKAAKPTKAAKPAKAAKPTKAAKAAKTPAQISAANLATMKKVTAKMQKVKAKEKKLLDEVENAFGSTGEFATSTSVDRDWDAIDDTMIPTFLR
jgi:hypothetical protein